MPQGDDVNWRFGDRFDEASFGDEEPVEIGIDRNEPGRGVTWLARMPESLVHRLVSLGEAYKLHHIPLIEVYGRTRFNRQQCQNLREELDFVKSIVDDPLLRSHLARWTEVVNDCLNHERPQAELVIEGP